MSRRPKRKIFKKKLEFNEGLHWQEERDLHRALYASLQPSKEEQSSDSPENGDFEGPIGDSQGTIGDSQRTIGLGNENRCWQESMGVEESSSVGQEETVSETTETTEVESESTDVSPEPPKKAEVVLNHVARTLRPPQVGRCHNEKKLIRRLYERGIKRRREEEERRKKAAAKRKKKRKKKAERERMQAVAPPLKLACLKDVDLQNKKIHAQRKFAVSCSPSASPYKPSPLSTPTPKSKQSEANNILSFIPKTEDFLTFLCLRGTPVLPPNLELFRKSHQKSLKMKRKESARAQKEAESAEALRQAEAQRQAKAHRQATLLLKQHRNKSLLQKEKAKAVRTLNHWKHGPNRPWRECKGLIKINKKIRKPRNLTDIPTAPLTPPCLSPIPPPIMSITEHHNPPPLIPIMPLDGAGTKERKSEDTTEGQSAVKKTNKKQQQAAPPPNAARTTSHNNHCAKSTTNAATTEAYRVLMKRKLRSSGEPQAGDTIVRKRGRKVKVRILKREVSSLLEGQENGRLPASEGLVIRRKKTKVTKLNGKIGPHGPVTRTNKVVDDAEVGLVLNGLVKDRKKRKVGRLKESSKKKDLAKMETKGGVAKEVAKHRSNDGKEVAPRRSTRKRIPRFDVQCVYSGLLSSSNAIIQSADCVCACCNAEERKPRKRNKSNAGEGKMAPRLLRNLENRTNVVEKSSNNAPGKGDPPPLHGMGEAPQQEVNIKVEPTSPGAAETCHSHSVSGKGIGVVQSMVLAGKASTTTEESESSPRVKLNGSYHKLSTPGMLVCKEAVPLVPPRNHHKPLRVKNDGIYKNGKAFVKKLRNGSNMSLDAFGVTTPKYIQREEAGENASEAMNLQNPAQERKHLAKSLPPRKVISNPLRRQMEKQFCAKRPSSPFSHKPKKPSPASSTLGSMSGRVGGIIPITMPSVATEALIRDIESLSPSNNSTNLESNMEEVPTLHPTYQEWADLVGYLESNAGMIKKYGMCKVKPPEGCEPTGSFPDSLKLTPEIQYVHRLRHRWSSASKRLACLRRHLERKEKVAFQPPQICGCEVDLLKFSELLSLEDGFKAVRAKKKWPKLADQLNIPRNVPGRTNKLEQICLKYLVSFANLARAEKDELMKEVEVERQHRLDAGDCNNPFNVAQSEVRRAGHQTSLCQFKQRADLLEQIIRAGEDNTPSDIEDEFWKIIEESDSYVAAQKAEVHAGSGSRYESNLRDLADGSSNILSVLPQATRQRLPSLKVGTVYSAEPWRVNGHNLGRIEYLHSGNHKIWYSIPGSQSSDLENVLQEHAAEAKGHLPCLHDKSFIFMLPPEVLQKWGLTVYRCIQHRQELIVQWYDAAASSVSCGFHIAESFPLASSEWLGGAVRAFELCKAWSQPSPFSLEQLLYLLIEDIWQGHKPCDDLVIKMLPVFKAFRNKELQLRAKLQSAGLNLMSLADKTSSSPARGSRSPGRSGPRVPDEELVQCLICNQHCYFSLVTNEREDRVYCLEHAVETFNNGKNYSAWTVYYRLGQEKMSEVIKILSQAIPTAALQDIRGEIMSNSFHPIVGTTAVA